MATSRLTEREPTAEHDAAAPRVRQALARDLDAVVALRVALLREYPDHPVYGRLRTDVNRRARELFAAQLRASGEVIFLGELAGEVVGVLRCVELPGSPLLMPERYAYVSSVYVRPDARRRGVMRALVRAAQRWSEARGLDQLRLHNVAGSAAAEGAWDALGFTVVEQVRIRDIAHRRD